MFGSLLAQFQLFYFACQSTQLYLRVLLLCLSKVSVWKKKGLEFILKLLNIILPTPSIAFSNCFYLQRITYLQNILPSSNTPLLRPQICHFLLQPPIVNLLLPNSHQHLLVLLRKLNINFLKTTNPSAHPNLFLHFVSHLLLKILGITGKKCSHKYLEFRNRLFFVLSLYTFFLGFWYHVENTNNTCKSIMPQRRLQFLVLYIFL